MGPVRIGLAAFAALAAFGAAGCSGQAELAAPTEVGVCWHLVRADGQWKFNRLAANQPQLEHCAARLEEMRIRFMMLGSEGGEVTGAYQGQFIFLNQRGVYTARSLSTTPYLAMVRTGDGRLAIPGAITQ
jgi:hypothetical protein